MGNSDPQRFAGKGAGPARVFGIAATLDVTSMDQTEALAELMFHRPGPTFAVAKIALTDEPWALPEKDGAVIARRFREAARPAG